MTIPAYNEEIAFGNDIVTAFDFSFKIISSAFIKVYIVDMTTGLVELLAPNTYSVSGVNDDDGGTVTLINRIPTTTDKIVIISSDIYVQNISILNQSGFLPEVIEGGLDYTERTVQQLEKEVGRSLRGAVGEPPFDRLPTAQLRANHFLGFDAGGAPIMAETVNVGTVVMEAPFIDNALLRYDGTTGRFIQGGPLIANDAGDVTGLLSLHFGVNQIAEVPGNIDSTLALRLDDRLGIAVAIGPSRRFHVHAGDESASVTATRHVPIYADTSDRSSTRTIQVKAIHGKTIIGPAAQDGHVNYGILGEVEAYNNVSVGASDNHCAFYGAAYKFGTGKVFGIGVAANDLNVYATTDEVSALTGGEMAAVAFGRDDLVGNDGAGVREVLRVAGRASDEPDILIGGIVLGVTTVVTSLTPHALVNGDLVWVQDIDVGSTVELNDTEFSIAARGGGGTIGIASIVTAVNGKITINTSGVHGRDAGTPVWITGVVGTFADLLNNQLFNTGEVTASSFVLLPFDNKYPRTDPNLPPFINGTDYGSFDEAAGTVSWFTTFELKTPAGVAVNSSGYAPFTTGGEIKRIAEFAEGLHVRPNSQTFIRYRYGIMYEDQAPVGWQNPLAASIAALALRTGAPIGIKFDRTPGIAIDTTNATLTGPAFNMATGQHMDINGVPVVGAPDTGWAAMTGTPNKAAVYDVAAVTLPQLAGRVAALQALLTTRLALGA